MVMPLPPDDRARRAIDAIYELLFHGCAWPRFVDLDRFLDGRGEPDAESILLGMAPGIVHGVSPSQPVIRDDQEIALTVAGLASCTQATEDIGLFLSTIRHATDLERALEPGQPTAELSSDTIAEAIALPAAGRDDLVARLGEILKVENWGWSSASHGDGRWSFGVDRRVRRLRDVTTVEDYWMRTRPHELADGEVRASERGAAEFGMDDSEDRLSIFISYSHADKPVAKAIAAALEDAGARVWIDEGELRTGDSIIERIATAIMDVHFVVALISENSIDSAWCKKELALGITEGLGREGVKLLPLRLGDVTMPPSLADVYYRQVDPAYPAEVTTQLMEDAWSHRQEREAEGRTRRASGRVSAPIQQVPTAAGAGDEPWSGVVATGYGKEVVHRARQAGPTPAEYARSGLKPQRRQADDRRAPGIAEGGPLKLIGIVREGIGRPQNDGTRGSALYAVPFRLSRAATDTWARMFEKTWDHPSEWTSMHRPGVCRVQDDVITLNGVTVDEVERYHLKTLKLCVDRVNEEIDRQEREQAVARAREQQRLSEHDAAVDETIDRLEFD